MGTSGQRSLKSKSFIKQTPPKVGFLIKIHFRNFQKPKIKLKKDPLKFQKLKTYIRRPQIKKFYKTGPPKVGIVIQNTILKFSNTKNLTQKDPQKLQKNENIYEKASNKKVL